MSWTGDVGEGLVRSIKGRIAIGLLLGTAIMATVAGPASGAVSPRDAGGPPPLTADDRPATELRVTLGRLLGEHAFLVMETMRAGALGRGEQAALGSALDDNTAELTAAVSSVYGDAGGTRFGELWSEHVDLLVAYAEARGADDGAAAEEARTGLEAYVRDFSRFLAEANPELRADAEEEALDLHIDQVTAFADADYARAYASQREAFRHMFDLGDHLALAMARQFPERFPDGAIAFSPRSDLRLTLDRLLGEHVVLSAETMRAGVTDGPDFDAGREALAANSADLAAAVGSIYGSAAAEQFGAVWGQHVDAYILFVEALGADDEDARAASLMELHGYHEQLSQLLAAVNPQLEAGAVGDLIRRHVQGLISQAEAAAAEDHERSVAATRDAYDGMFVVGAALADAIAAQFPERFEDLRELPATSTGESVRTSEGQRAAGLTLAFALFIAAFAMLGLGVRRAPAGTRRRARRPR